MIKSYSVKPVKGLKVPNPATGQFLSDKGEIVEASSYWQRRIEAKEVTVSEVKQAETKQNEPSKVNEERKSGGN